MSTAHPLAGSAQHVPVGLLTGHSTETALLKVVGDIQRAAGDGKCTVLLALDISAAFDAVDHSLLGARTLPSAVPSISG